MHRGHLSRDLLAHSSSRTPSPPHDKSSIARLLCHPVVEESVRLSQAEYKILQRFYLCSVQSNVRTKSAQHRDSRQDIFTQQQHLLCLSSEVLEWLPQDSRYCLLASHSGILKEQSYLGIWDIVNERFSSCGSNPNGIGIRAERREPFVDYG